MCLYTYLAGYGTSPNMLPKIAGKYAGKNLIVCGDAECIWNDLERFGCRAANSVEKYGWDFLTVNRAIETFPGKVEHCYSNVYWVLSRFIKARRDEYMHEFGKPRYSHAITEGADFTWPWVGQGTSGLGAILTGLALGYDRIVLAGIPLTNTPHNGEPWWRKTRFTTEVKDQDQHWSNAINKAFDGKVTSLSGRTAEWLGEPRLGA